MLCCVVLSLVCAAACAKRGPSVDSTTLNTPETLRESRTSRIRQILNTFNMLNDIKVACGRRNGTDGEDGSLYCDEPIRVGDGYAPLKMVIATEMDGIHGKLTGLLTLEKKAVACRGMRYLLSIIMYGLFVDSLSEGNGIGGANIFPELYVPEDQSEDDYDDDGEPARDPIGSGDGDEIRADFVEKIVKLFRVVRLFARDDRRLDGVDEAIVSTAPWPDARAFRHLLRLAFRAVNSSYQAKCFPGYVNTAALLAANSTERDADRKIRALVAEADRAFATARDEFAVLCARFFPAVRPGQNNAPRWDVPVLYFQVLYKYCDAGVWPLIKDEVVRVDGAASTTLGAVVSPYGREITATAERLTRYARDAVKCRCLVYVNLMTKLYANAVRTLIANERGVRRLRTELLRATADRGGAWFGGGRPPRTEDELRTAFQWYHDRMKGFRVDGLRHGLDDVQPTAVHEDGRLDGAFAVYSTYHVWSVGEAVDAVEGYLDFLGDAAFAAQLTEMLSDMEDALRHGSPKRRTVAALTKWRERGERAYRDHCLAGDHRGDADPPPPPLAALNDAMKLVLRPDDETAEITLGWIVARTDDLNKHLEDDLTKSLRFNI